MTRDAPAAATEGDVHGFAHSGGGEKRGDTSYAVQVRTHHRQGVFFFFSVSFHFFLIFSVTQRTLREANAHWTSARVLS